MLKNHLYKKKYCAKKLLFFLNFIITSLSFAQSPYVVKQYTSEDGLPQNSIKDIQFDNQGFCWLTTESGIVRFDNKEFKTFEHENIKGLKSDRMFIMSKTMKGNIFVQNMDNQDLTITSPSPTYMNRPKIIKNNLYFYPYMGFLSQDKRIGHLWDSLMALSTFPLIRRFTSLHNGDIYLQYDNLLYYLTNDDHYYLIDKSFEHPLFTAPLDDTHFMQLWKSGKVTLWEKGRKKIHITLIDGLGKSSLKNVKLLNCLHGTFLYYNNAIGKIFIDQNEKPIYKTILQHLPSMQPSSIYYDPDFKTFYIGTTTQGLFVLKISDFNYIDIPPSAGLQNYYTVTKTYNDFIITKDLVISPTGKVHFVPLNNQYSIASYVSLDNQVYYEQEFQLVKYNPISQDIKYICPLDDRLVSIIPYNTNGDSILLCTKKSLSLLSLSNRRILWTKKINKVEKLTGLFPLKNGLYLLASTNGLKWYDLKQNKIIRSVLDSFHIRNVYNDSKGQLWISTDGNGSFLYSNQHLYPLPLGPSNALRTIHSFINDSNGNFWLPTNNGLFKVNIEALTNATIHDTPQKAYFYCFNKKDGLRTNEFNGGCTPAYQWMKDSSLIIPSIDGLVKFNPKQTKVIYPSQPIYIDEILLDGRSTPLINTNKLKLSPYFNTLSIKVGSPYFGVVENLRMEYTICEENTSPSQWLPLPTNGEIRINTIPNGKYNVIIRKISGDNILNQTLNIHLDVLPKFYNTWWFYLFLLVLVSATSLLIVHNRLNRIHKEKIRIEKIVTTRTHELDSTVKLLANSESALRKSNKIKEQTIAMLTHDLRSPIKFLGIISEYLTEQYGKLEKNYIQTKLKELNTSIRSLNIFIDQFFSWAVSQRDDFHSNIEDFALQQLFDEIYKLYVDILSFNNNVLSMHPTDVICHSDKNILGLILRNLVDNANKNTRNGTISLTAGHMEDGILAITVADDGWGLTPEDVKNFIDASKGINHTGMGSILILNMLGKINGKLSIQTHKEKGSSFTIIFPTITDG